MTIRKKISVGELERLAKELEPLKEAFDTLDDHVIITDANGNILYANEAMEKNTGFKINEVIGENPADLWGGKMPSEFYEEMWHTIKTKKQPFVGNVHNVRKDGTDYWQQLCVAPILDSRGTPLFYIGIEPNITEEKKKKQFQGDFTSFIGHQMKNPIASLRLTLDWLSANSKLTDKQRQTLEAMYAHQQALTNLVSDLLVLTQIEDLPKETRNALERSKRLKTLEDVAKKFHQSTFHRKLVVDTSGKVRFELKEGP